MIILTFYACKLPLPVVFNFIRNITVTMKPTACNNIITFVKQYHVPEHTVSINIYCYIVQH